MTTVTSSPHSREVANTILAQLGGRKFLAMTGAKNLGYADGPDGLGYLSFKLPSDPHFVRDGINYVKIELTPADLYRVEFGRAWGRKYAPKAQHDDVFAEDLPGLFEDVTGLRTRLF
jgi:hypothetical protein